MTPCPNLAPQLTVFSGQSVYASAAGVLTLGRRANITTQRVIFSAGAGPFTYNIILADTIATAGDIFRIILVFPASTHPTVQLQDSLSGNIADPISGTGFSFRTIIELTFNGVSWEVDDQSA